VITQVQVVLSHEAYNLQSLGVIIMHHATFTMQGNTSQQIVMCTKMGVIDDCSGRVLEDVRYKLKFGVVAHSLRAMLG
jgi:hypothetical protein